MESAESDGGSPPRGSPSSSAALSPMAVYLDRAPGVVREREHAGDDGESQPAASRARILTLEEFGTTLGEPRPVPAIMGLGDDPVQTRELGPTLATARRERMLEVLDQFRACDIRPRAEAVSGVLGSTRW